MISIIFPSTFHPRTQLFRLLVSLFFLILAIRDPIQRDGTDEAEKNGIPVMIMMDVSQSMKVQDIPVPSGIPLDRPGIDRNDLRLSRLDRVKYSIQEILISAPENIYGLWVFAGDAVGVIPLTYDQEQYLTLLWWLDERNVSIQGTDLEAAVRYGMTRLVSKAKSDLSLGTDEINDAVNIPWDQYLGALVLFSDGGDDLPPDMDIPYIWQADIYILGVGTVDGGPIIEWRDAFGRMSLKRYQWEVVQSALNASALTSLAKKLDGTYGQMIEGDDIDDLLDDLWDSDHASMMVDQDVRRSLGLIWVWISLFCFLCYICLWILRGTRN